MRYKIEYEQQARADMLKLAKSEPKALRKLQQLIHELAEHPTTGTGHPHQLTGDRSGQWARSITKKHRLVYMIKEVEVVVLVLTAYGHYDDK